MVGGKMENNIEFENPNNYSSGSLAKLSFREIVLLHLKKIGIFASVEFRGGFWQDKIINNGSVVIKEKIYISDTREVYSNAVEYLADLLYPHYDKKMKAKEMEIEKEKENAFKDKTIIKDENEVFKNQENKIFYRSKRMQINKKLFRELSAFLKRTNYLNIGSIDD